MFVRQEINNPRWANLIETFILTLYVWKLQQKKQKFVTWKNPTSGYPCLRSLRSAWNNSFARGKTSKKDFAGEKWKHILLGADSTWILSHQFLLLPDIHACLRKATLSGIVKKPNTVINISKGKNGEAAAWRIPWPFMWHSGVSISPWHISKGISGGAAWLGPWEEYLRENLTWPRGCRIMFSNLLGQSVALPIPDVHKTQGKSDKGLRLVKNLKLRFQKENTLRVWFIAFRFLSLQGALESCF